MTGVPYDAVRLKAALTGSARYIENLAAHEQGNGLIQVGPAYALLTTSPYEGCLVPLGHARVPNLGIAQREPAVYSFYRVDWARYDSLRAHARR